MGQLGDCLHVMAARRAVIHLGDHHHRHIGRNGGRNLFRRHDLELMPILQEFSKPLHHIEIGRKIAGIRKDNFAVTPLSQRGR